MQDLWIDGVPIRITSNGALTIGVYVFNYGAVGELSKYINDFLKENKTLPAHKKAVEDICDKLDCEYIEVDSTFQLRKEKSKEFTLPEIAEVNKIVEETNGLQGWIENGRILIKTNRR